MIKILKISILLFVITIGHGYCLSLPVSECYSYHTPNYYSVFADKAQVIFQHTVKDPNGISYVSRDEVAVDSVNADGFELLSESNAYFFFKTQDGYYLLSKDNYIQNGKQAYKIAEHNEITEFVDTRFFCKNNEWMAIEPKSYSDTFLENKIPLMPENLEFITDVFREGILYKNDQAVYAYDYENYTFNVVPDLEGESTRFITNLDHSSDSFLYDNDTFYISEYRSLKNITADFSHQPQWKGFTNVEVVKSGINISLNTNDGYIWVYHSNGVIINEIRSTFEPLIATYLGDHCEFLKYKGKIFIHFEGASKNSGALNFDEVKNPFKIFLEFEDIYSDGESKYYYDYDNKVMQLIDWLPGDSKFYEEPYTYNYLGNPPLYIDDSYIYFIETRNNNLRKIKHSSDVKDLKLAYAFDDKVLLRHKEMKNLADRETIVFLGSKVEVISSCDGGKGQYPVHILIYYFFKDKTGVYGFRSDQTEMFVLKDLNPHNYHRDNYNELVQLKELAEQVL